jgi:5'(3')-deoxyribonucleotidase
MKTYLDMDGVIADFFSEAVKLSKCEVKSWREMEFRDVERVLKHIRKNEKDFFLRLKPFPTTNTLVQCIHNIAGGFTILSSPLEGYDDCAEQKIMWLAENLLLDPDDIIITTDKTKYANGNILIDDYGYNCRRWEEAGGFAIKYQADEAHMNEVIIPLSTLYKGTK